jgi:hypothetical protein
MQLNYAQIGRLVATRKPEIIDELMVGYLRPPQTNFNKIEGYYTKFTNINPSSSSLKELVESRRIFIAVMFHLYQPEVFTNKSVYIKPGLGKAISKEVGVQDYNLSKMLREIIVMERAYDDFKDKVLKILEVI